MTFRVGQKVVCIDDKPRRGFSPILPVKGRIYTVRWAGQRQTDIAGPGIMLDEHSGGIHPLHGVEYCFAVGRFRPIVERKTDISVFTAMLKPSKVKA